MKVVDITDTLRREYEELSGKSIKRYDTPVRNITINNSGAELIYLFRTYITDHEEFPPEVTAIVDSFDSWDMSMFDMESVKFVKHKMGASLVIKLSNFEKRSILATNNLVISRLTPLKSVV